MECFSVRICIDNDRLPYACLLFFNQICQILKWISIGRLKNFCCNRLRPVSGGEELSLLAGPYLIGKKADASFSVISIIPSHSHTPRKLEKWFSLSEVIFPISSRGAKSLKTLTFCFLRKNNIDFRGFCYGGQGIFPVRHRGSWFGLWEARHFFGRSFSLEWDSSVPPPHLSNP